jgi:2-keto-4-pentenoate hydratase
MTNNIYSQAATTLLNRRCSAPEQSRLAANLRPVSTDDALLIQQQIEKHRNDEVGGWKCLLPLDADKMIVAPIFSDTIQKGEHCQIVADNGVARIEPEIAFILSKDLPAKQQDYTESEIDAAIGSCHMALELIQSRFSKDCGAEFNELLADCLSNQGLFLGPEISKSKAYAASKINLTVTQNEYVQKFEGEHPNLSAQKPVYWLINFMSKRGTEFKAGQAIITGSYAGVLEVNFDQQCEIEYQDIGKYQVEFKALS